ncbi:MAG TPA: hypothetical protein VFW78_08555 [Bacteroidia bacterium]|nr:hypothetical protein [Bacteroidia bacterium]
MGKPEKMARVATIILLIALVRTLSEPFRLQYYSGQKLDFEMMKPFLMAGLLIAGGLIAMQLAGYFKKHLLMSLIAVLVIAGMVAIKVVYLN